MKCLFVGFMFLVYNYYVICGQNLILPSNKEIAHVSGDNSTIMAQRIPILFRYRRVIVDNPSVIIPQLNKCPPGSRRSTLGKCIKVTQRKMQRNHVALGK